MKITLFANERDNRGRAVDLTWEELARLLTDHRRGPKSGPAWSPVELEGTRANKNVKSIAVAVFDLDHLTPAQIYDVAARLDSSPFAAILHSTHSHTDAEPSARVVLKLSRQVLPAEWSTVRSSLERMFELPADKATSDVARLYYLPAALEGAPVIGALTDGTEAVDVEVLLHLARTAMIDQATAEASVPASATATSAVDLGTVPGNARGFFDSEGAVDMDAVRVALRGYHGSHRETMLKALRGQAIAEEGGRDNTLQRIMGAAAYSLPLEVPEEAIFEIFRESISQLGPDWLPVAADKLRRARERKAVERAQQKASMDSITASVRRESVSIARSMGDNSSAADEEEGPLPEKYTEEQIARWAHEQGCDSVDSFRRRWIIQNATAFYIFSEGRYLPPISKEELAVSLPRDLVRSPLALTTVGANGNIVRRPVASLLEDHATVARRTECRLDLQASHYDAKTQKFYEAVCPVRPIQPIEHPEVDKWLRLLGSSDVENFLDWTASVTDLARQTPAVYLDGVKGVGKTLYAAGLSRLWDEGGPSDLVYCLEGFNDSLTRCPLVLADEKLPDKKGITGALRQFLGSNTRTLQRKFLPSSRLVGAVRLVIAGNNERLLENSEELSIDDLEAVNSRFFYVKADPSAAGYIISLGGPDFVQQRWINEGAIAEHALWLKKTRKVNRSQRFLVESKSTDFHANLATSSGISAAIGEWLVKWLSEPPAGENPLICTGEGELWVNAEVICRADTWEKRMANRNVPSVTRAGRALRLLSTSSMRVRVGEHQVTYHRIKVDVILSQAARLQIGDIDQIRSRIQSPNERIAKALKHHAEKTNDA